MVAYALDNGKALSEFTIEEFKSCSDIIEDDIYEAISLETCVNERNIIGGPAAQAVQKAIDAGYVFIENI